MVRNGNLGHKKSRSLSGADPRFRVVTNTFSNLYKYILQLVKIYSAIWTNTVDKMGWKKSWSLFGADPRFRVVAIAP